jgi:hypothetical protein
MLVVIAIIIIIFELIAVNTLGDDDQQYFRVPCETIDLSVLRICKQEYEQPSSALRNAPARTIAPSDM